MNLLDFFHETVAQVPAMPAGVVVLSKATLLLAVAWLIHFALTKADPRWRVLLWRATVVGLLLLAVWAIGLPGYAVHVEGPEPVAVSAPPAVAALDPVVFVEAPAAAVEAPVFDEMTTAAVQPFSVDVPPEVTRPVEASRPPVPWRAVLAGIWATSVVLLVVRLAVAYVRLASLLRNWQSAPDAVVAEVGRIAAALGCNRVVRVCRSERFAVPFLYGLRRPVLVLPQRMCETSYCSQLPGILAHEIAHTRSRDLAWNTVLQAVSIGLWFHPLAWRVGSAHRAACDRVADAVSAAYLGDVQAYCQTLARVALEAGSQAPSVGLAMARRSDVRRRLALLQSKVFATPLKRRLVAGVGLVGLMVFALLAGVRFVAAEAAAPAGNKQRPETDSPVAEKPGVRPMRIEVLDPEGEPIAGASVTVWRPTPTQSGAPLPPAPRPQLVITDAKGTARIESSTAEALRLNILVRHDEYVTARLHWPPGTTQQLTPADTTVTLGRGTVLGGIVRNEQGEPLADAELTVSGSKSQPGEGLSWSINDRVRSDADGKWSSHCIPEDLKGFDAKITVRHASRAGRSVFEVAKLSIDELRARTAVMVVRDGITVEGTVTDPEGKPVAGALVGQFAGHPWSDYPRATTDRHGRYRLAGHEPGECILATAAEGHAPVARQVEVTEDRRKFDLQLRQGSKPIRLQVVDQDGKPVAEAAVSDAGPKPATLNTAMLLVENDRNPTTDADGRWSRLWIPKDELEFLVHKHGYGAETVSFAPDEREQVVTLEAVGWGVSGRVVDRQTKAPVTKFHVAQGREYNHVGFWYGIALMWDGARTVKDANGEYRVPYWHTSIDSRPMVRIEAEGYLPSDTLRLTPDERSVTFDVELIPTETVTGAVLSSDGKPLAGAYVALFTASWRLMLENGRPHRWQDQHLIVKTAADGRFSLTPPPEPYALMVVHDEGFARVENEEDMKAITIQPWARVEGTVSIGSKPAADQLVKIEFESSFDPGAPMVHPRCSATTDERGRFTFDRVFPGEGLVVRYASITDSQLQEGGTRAHLIPATFVAGQTTHVELSRDGRPVIGKLLMPDGSEEIPLRNTGFAILQAVPPSGLEILSPPKIPWPADIDPRKDRDRALAWWETWKESEQGRRYKTEVKPYQTISWSRQSTAVQAEVARDGSFLFEDMPAGDYRLEVHVFGPPINSHSHIAVQIGTVDHEFTIPEMPGGRSDEPLDIGDLTPSPRDN